MSGIVAEVGAHVKIDLIQFKVGGRGCVDKLISSLQGF